MRMCYAAIVAAHYSVNSDIFKEEITKITRAVRKNSEIKDKEILLYLLQLNENIAFNIYSFLCLSILLDLYIKKYSK